MLEMLPRVNGQLYGEPVRLEWNKPRLRKENCWPCTSWTLLSPALYRVNGGGTANGWERKARRLLAASAKRMDEARCAEAAVSQEWRSAAVGHGPGRAKARSVVPSDVSLDSHDSRK